MPLGWTIANFHRNNPLEGYRRLTFMMKDAGVVAASAAPEPASALARRRELHQFGGTFYYLCGILDGFGRSVPRFQFIRISGMTPVRTAP
jgi:hypothetical protein